VCLGERLLGSLQVPLIQHSEYLQMVLSNLFSGVPAFDHIESLLSKYSVSAPALRRELVRAAGAGGEASWIKERKDEFHSSDPWLRQALLSVASCLPGDEGRHWVRKLWRDLTATEKMVARWGLRLKEAKYADIALAE
jgi:hypothetical protein